MAGCVSEHKLDPGVLREARIVPSGRLRERRDAMDEFLHTARFGPETLYRQIAGLGYVLLLTDAKGITVDFIGDPTFNNNLRKAGAVSRAAPTSRANKKSETFSRLVLQAAAGIPVVMGRNAERVHQHLLERASVRLQGTDCGRGQPDCLRRDVADTVGPVSARNLQPMRRSNTLPHGVGIRKPARAGRLEAEI